MRRASFPDQMMILDASVSDIRYVNYTTVKVLKCFAVEIVGENPSSLTEGMTVTCWAQDADGGEIYAVDNAKLAYLLMQI